MSWKFLWKKFWSVNWRHCFWDLICYFWEALNSFKFKYFVLLRKLQMKLPSELSFNAFRSLAMEFRTFNLLIPRRLVRSSRQEVFYKNGVQLNKRPATLLKKSLWHRCFPVNFAKFLRTLFLQKTSGGCFWLVYDFLVYSNYGGRRYHGLE